MIICITGMHRSGTSLTTSWLELCGLRSHDGNIIGAHTGNPKGHFEDKDFVDLHSSAILRKYPKSRGWKAVTDNFEFFESQHLQHATNLISQRNTKYELWGWKDPRSVLYLRQWKEIIPSLKVLLIWRPCSEVVQSLAKRSRKATAPVFNINSFQSVKLWMSYNKKVFEYKVKYPNDTLLIPLEYIVKYDQDVLCLVNKKFQMDLKYRPISDVYDRNLLNKGTVPLLTRWAAKCLGSSKLEKVLCDLSDVRSS